MKLVVAQRKGLFPVVIAAALLLPYRILQNAPPPPKELGADSFAGVWVEENSSGPKGLLIEYQNKGISVTHFSCKTPPNGQSYKQHYPAKSGTPLGDLCLRKLR